MSRKSNGPQLYKRPSRREGGKFKPAMWVVRDKQKVVSTGIAAGAAETTPPAEAEQFLAKYIAEKFDPTRRARDIANIPLSDVLAIYYHDKGGEHCTDPNLAGHIERLNEYSGDKKLIQVNPATCRAYVSSRPGQGGARRDLEVLRAAINNHAQQNLHYGTVNVTLPRKGGARQEWITRDQAAAIIWAAYRYREVQTIHRGPRQGQAGRHRQASAAARRSVSSDRLLHRHARWCYRVGLDPEGARQVLCRPGRWALLSPGDRQAGYQEGAADHPAAASPAGTHASLGSPWARERELRRVHGTREVREEGLRQRRPDREGRGQDDAAHAAPHRGDLADAERRGAEWVAAGYLGMSVEVLRNTYGHHHPDFMKGAIDGITGKGKKGSKAPQSVPQFVPNRSW